MPMSEWKDDKKESKKTATIKRKRGGGCYHCGDLNHRGKDCPSVVCRHCGKSGHDVGGCPHKPLPPVNLGHFAAATASSTTTSNSRTSFTFVELFAGIGGFRVALEKLGGKCVFASEIDTFCVTNYSLNFNGDVPAGDITRIESKHIPSHNLLVGGFPCQPFSTSNRKQDGLNDTTRGMLYREIVRILKEKQPETFVLENVRGLLLHDDGNTFHIIRQELESCNYQVCWEVLDAVTILPQERRRLFIVGIRNDIIVQKGKGNGGGGDDDHEQHYQFPTLPNLHRGVQDILQGLTKEDPLSVDECDKLKLTTHQIDKVKKQKHTQQYPESRFLSDFTKPSKTLQASYTNYMVGSQFVATTTTTTASASAAVPIAGSSSSNDDTAGEPTAESATGGGGSGRGWRKFSPREVARLMGFPESFTLCNQRSYHMLGNAVAPPLIASIVAPLLSIINTDDRNNKKNNIAKKRYGGGDDGWEVTCEMLLDAAPQDSRKEELQKKLLDATTTKRGTTMSFTMI